MIKTVIVTILIILRVYDTYLGVAIFYDEMIYFLKVNTSRYYFCKSKKRHLNAIFNWKLFQLLLGSIIFDKLKNPLWGVLYYFDTGVPKPNKKPFLPVVIISPYFFQIYHNLPFI